MKISNSVCHEKNLKLIYRRFMNKFFFFVIKVIFVGDFVSDRILVKVVKFREIVFILSRRDSISRRDKYKDQNQSKRLHFYRIFADWQRCRLSQLWQLIFCLFLRFYSQNTSKNAKTSKVVKTRKSLKKIVKTQRFCPHLLPTLLNWREKWCDILWRHSNSLKSGMFDSWEFRRRSLRVLTIISEYEIREARVNLAPRSPQVMWEKSHKFAISVPIYFDILQWMLHRILPKVRKLVSLQRKYDTLVKASRNN